MIDTLRADHVGCGEPSPVETPALCGLVSEGGTRFFGFSHASWTKPSAASLLLGLLPSTHGADVEDDVACRRDVEMVAEALRSTATRPAASSPTSTWRRASASIRASTSISYLAPDYIAGASESSSKLILYQMVRKVWFRLRPGYRVGDYYQERRDRELPPPSTGSTATTTRGSSSSCTTWIRTIPTSSIPTTARAIARVTNDHPDPSLAPEMQRLYQGEIGYLDAQLARLWEKLRALGIYDDTLIVLTADHGEEFHEHGGLWHGLTLYDEQMHVPLLVKWPKGAAAGAPKIDGQAGAAHGCRPDDPVAGRGADPAGHARPRSGGALRRGGLGSRASTRFSPRTISRATC